MENKRDSWYEKLFSLLKLEGTSTHGRVNLAGVFIVTVFCLLYSASDALRHAISSTENVIKTIVLKEEIYHKYESTGVVEVVIPIIIVFVLCLLFLMWHEHKKRK